MELIASAFKRIKGYTLKKRIVICLILLLVFTVFISPAFASNAKIRGTSYDPHSQDGEKQYISPLLNDCFDDDEACISDHLDKLLKDDQNMQKMHPSKQIRDNWVLNVQQYLNQTYGSINSWDHVPETGNTGWLTIYGLIEGLQYELGIDSLVQNFGPTTQSLYDQKLGNLSSSFSGINGAVNEDRGSRNRILRLVNASLWCKGYSTSSVGNIAGDIDEGRAESIFDAINEMAEDAGISSVHTLNLKFALALFSMVQFQVVAGGSDQIHDIQQDFNRRYALNHSSFDLVPTDGIYSREVNVGLIYALQYELGYDDDSATGFVGSGTKAGIMDKATFELSANDGGSYYVHLFEAAMIFNQYPISYDGNFSVSDSHRVGDFQNFYAIANTKRADYTTWLSLLISTGDPERNTAACDAASRMTADRILAVKSLGCNTVGRYLSNPYSSLPEKALTKPEADAIIQSGMSIIPIMQEDNSKVEYFDYDYGYEQGTTASQKSKDFGFPGGSMVYFAVDADAIEYEVYDNIVPYFQGVHDAIAAAGSNITVGIYSERNTCRIVINSGLAGNCYVSDMSTGYSGNLSFPLPSAWGYDQIAEIDTGSGFSIDKVVMRAGAPKVSRVVLSTSPESSVQNYLSQLQDIAQQHTSNLHDANLMVAKYLRNRGYSGGDGGEFWNILFGTPDSSFANDVKSRGITEFSTYLDPILGRDIDIFHTFAAINGYLYHNIKYTPNPPRNPRLADLASWAGDAVTFECEYRKSNTKLSVEEWTNQSFNKSSSFGDEDLAQDFDAINIAFAVQNNNLRLSDAFNNYYTGLTRQLRFNSAVIKRFESMDYLAKAFYAATSGLNIGDPDASTNPGTRDGSDAEYNAARALLETRSCGPSLPLINESTLERIAKTQSEIITGLMY